MLSYPPARCLNEINKLQLCKLVPHEKMLSPGVQKITVEIGSSSATSMMILLIIIKY